jgi:ubiquinone biosynthesis monooxygenase Coq7
MSTKHRRPLPGDPVGKNLIDRIMRVDHAGEYGAKRIYDGQLAVLGNSPAGDTIRTMADAEAEHLEWFDNELVVRHVRPTALHPFWHVAGYALGAATAMMGTKAAMACTVAVEEAIDEHYTAQQAALGRSEPKLKKAIERFHADELHHRDTALEHGAEKAPGYRAMKHAIKNGVRAAIWLSERV